MNQWGKVLKQAGYPTTALVLDFESYFDDEYSLKKMSTVEYVCDPRFHLNGMGHQWVEEDEIEDSSIKFILPHTINDWIEVVQIAWGENFECCTIVGQNLKFDCLILKEHFGIIPKYTVDIRDLSRHLDARDKHSLAYLAKKYKAPKSKGNTQKFKGMKWKTMTEKQREAYIEYTESDVEIETFLFKKLLPLIARPEIELPLATHTLQMYLNPQIEIDTKLGEEIKQKMKQEMLKPLKDLYDLGIDVSQKDVSGDKSFLTLLNQHLDPNEQVPMKQGKNGKIPALAREDEGMKYLVKSHHSAKVRALATARLAISSWPLHIKKVNNIIKQAVVRSNKIGAPLTYYAGHLGRWGGTEGINLQNLGGRGRKGSGTHPLIREVRQMLCAPDGYVFGIVDFAQIEARILAWFAGQNDLLQAFAEGRDVYSEFATEDLFKEPIRKAKETDPMPVKQILTFKRGFAKDAILGCIAEGAPVLTNNGWKPIETITLSDKLWDGIKWVKHQGVVKTGKKECIKVGGIWLTPEHEILQKAEWITAAELNINNLKLGKNLERLQLWKFCTGNVVELSPSNAVVPVVESLLHQGIIWSQKNLHAVMSVLKRHPVKLRAIKQVLEAPTGQDCLIEFVQSLVDVKPTQLKNMVSEVLESGPIGSEIEWLFLNTWQHYQDGIIQNWRLIGSTMIKDMSLVISDLLPESKILKTVDILYSGPHKRFQCGNMIVSNCGYGMGTLRFYDDCRANDALRPAFDSGEYDFEFIDGLIKTYRTRYSKIPEFWQTVEKAWKFVTKYQKEQICVCPDIELYFYNDNGTTIIKLPSGRLIRYPYASVNKQGSLLWRWGKLWGGSITENIVQATARDILGESILYLTRNGINIVLHIHDELVCLLEKTNAKSKLEEIIEAMERIPYWAQGLPIAVEGKLVERYEK